MRYLSLLLLTAANLLFATLSEVQVRKVNGDLIREIRQENLLPEEWGSLCAAIKGDELLSPAVYTCLQSLCIANGFPYADRFIPMFNPTSSIGVINACVTVRTLLINPSNHSQPYFRQVPLMSLPENLRKLEVGRCEWIPEVPELELIPLALSEGKNRSHAFVRFIGTRIIDYHVTCPLTIKETDMRAFSVVIYGRDDDKVRNILVRIRAYESLNVEFNLDFSFYPNHERLQQVCQRIFKRYPGDSLISLFLGLFRWYPFRSTYHFPEEEMTERFQSISEGWEVREFANMEGTLYSPDNEPICRIIIATIGADSLDQSVLESLPRNLPLRELLLHTTSMPRPA